MKALLWMVLVLVAANPGDGPVRVAPEKLPKLATVDERYQSYNVEMLEVTGGMFWKPYDQMTTEPQPVATTGSKQEGASFYARLKQPLPPTDLSQPELRKLARALGPVYVRVSGNGADSVYFHDSDAPPPSRPPEGFDAVLTRKEWKNVVDFAHAVNGEIVTSFAVSAGTRDAKGRWTPDQARKWMEYTKSIGGTIAAAEFFNEPTLGPQGIGGLPRGYTAGDYAKDFAVFRPFAKSIAPDMLILGPSATGEGPVKLLAGSLIPTQDILTATPKPQFDGFSYHAYSASSIRCKAPGKLTTTADAALTQDWLSRTEVTYEFYASLRDKYEPHTPMWVTETAESSCGGDPWAKTFLDTFRYLDQLGRLARHGVRSVMHNTLAVSEYALIDGKTLKPRPNYWGALLWRRLMGTTVLDSGAPQGSLHLYAHCLPERNGGVALLAINTSQTAAGSIELGTDGERYTLSAPKLEGEEVRLNGHVLALDGNGDLPTLNGVHVPAGQVEFAPTSITFLAVPSAGNDSCR